MLTAKELLLEGEELIGDYNVEVARWRDDRWTSTIPPLYATLTNHRLILQPHGRKRLEPAIIPRRYLTRVDKMNAHHRNGLILHLQTGHRIGLFITGDAEHTMLRHLQQVVSIPPKKPFKPSLDMKNLQKLIDFFAELG